MKVFSSKGSLSFFVSPSRMDVMYSSHFSFSVPVAQPSPGLAASGGERSAGHEGDPLADRVHVAQPQAGDRVHPRGRSALGAQIQNEDQSDHPREGTGKGTSGRALHSWVMRFEPNISSSSPDL